MPILTSLGSSTSRAYGQNGNIIIPGNSGIITSGSSYTLPYTTGMTVNIITIGGGAGGGGGSGRSSYSGYFTGGGGGGAGGNGYASSVSVLPGQTLTFSIGAAGGAGNATDGIYGGGSNGLMGTVAMATKAAGGRVVGIIPHALADKETANTYCDELHMVDNMHQRKFMMAERADAFLALPGGIGTFEELFEVWTWKQLGFHNKPIGLLNVDGYYDGLLSFMQNTVDHGFVSD